MNQTNFKKLLKARFKKIEDTFTIKQKEYANDIDVFENIKNGVGLSVFTTEPEQVAWNYAAKHLESIISMLESAITSHLFSPACFFTSLNSVSYSSRQPG